MAAVDLHLHSTASDGSRMPDEVVVEAAARGVEVIALCDHDTVAGVAPALEAGRAHGVRVLPAVELTCYHRGRSLHLLGYGVPHEHPDLLADLQARREVRRRHVERILDQLDRLGSSLDRVRLFGQDGGRTVGRPHVAQALVEAGHVADTREAFDRFLRKDRPAYLVPEEPQSPLDAIALLHRLGAVAVLAHPALDRGHLLFDELTAGGLDGVEVYHASHSLGLVTVFRAEAVKRGLLITGGSDNHGPHRPPDIGEVEVPEDVVTPLLAALAAGP